MDTPMPEAVKNIVVMNVNEVEKVASTVDFVFSAVDMSKDEIKAIEEEYAKTETPVVSNNSAHRWTPDVPMVVPEINPEHFDVNAVIRRTYLDAMRIASVLPDISCATFNPDNLDDPKELDGTDVAVVKGEIGVAENGAIWIPQTVKYKAIYFISEKLVILLDRNKIVDTMYDAYRELDGQEYQFGTFISGPSKTADIEQALVMGAHGARDVLVILT